MKQAMTQIDPPDDTEVVCEVCGAGDDCQCPPEEILSFVKNKLEKLFDCEATINLYSEGALLASTEEDDITW